jgi:hypothetical protein
MNKTIKTGQEITGFWYNKNFYPIAGTVKEIVRKVLTKGVSEPYIYKGVDKGMLKTLTISGYKVKVPFLNKIYKNFKIICI